MAAAPRRRRVTVVNQFFPPDLSPTAHLTASLVGHLAEQGWEVTVITGGDGYVDRVATAGPDAGEPAAPVVPPGVRVRRLWTPALGKGSILKRLADYASFLAGAALRLLRLPAQDVVISLTTPPFVVVGAVAHSIRHRRARVVLWSMDCYPDVIERLGSRTDGPPSGPGGPGGPRRGVGRRTLGVVRAALAPVLSMRRGGPASRLLRAVNRAVFRRLDHVVVLDEAMRDLLVDGYGTDAGGPPMTVIPNWESLADFPPPDPAATGRWDGYDRPELADRFVVLYLGNLGYGHRIETVVDAAATLDDGVAWLFVGGGVRWDELAARVDASPGRPQVIRHPYVAKEQTPAVMAGAGCALIVLGDEALGVMSPSKLHANLAAGLPIVYVGPAGSNVDAAIERFGCGVSIRPGDAEGLARAVRHLRDDPAHRAELSAAARHAFETAYCDRATLAAWDDVLATVVGGPAPG